MRAELEALGYAGRRLAPRRMARAALACYHAFAMDTSESALLWSTPNYMDASLASRLLDAAGIPCIVDECNGLGAGIYSTGPGSSWFRIFVRSPDVARARGVIEQAWGHPLDPPSG